MNRLNNLMIVVAILALNLAAVRVFDGEMEDPFAFTALPVVSVLALAAIFCRKAFIPGFAVAASVSLFACQLWADTHPWDFLHYVTPPVEFVDRTLSGLAPSPRYAIIYVLAIIAFSLPHVFLGMVGGLFTSRAWRAIR